MNPQIHLAGVSREEQRGKHFLTGKSQIVSLHRHAYRQVLYKQFPGMAVLKLASESPAEELVNTQIAEAHPQRF